MDISSSVRPVFGGSLLSMLDVGGMIQTIHCWTIAQIRLIVQCMNSVEDAENLLCLFSVDSSVSLPSSN